MAITPASALPSGIAAVVAALRADAALAGLLGGAKVYSMAPPDVTRPYLWVQSGQEQSDNAMGRTFRRVAQLEVVAISGYEGTAEVDALTSRVMQVLDATDLVLDGYGTGKLRWIGTQRSELLPSLFDGQPEFQRRAVFELRAG